MAQYPPPPPPYPPLGPRPLAWQSPAAVASIIAVVVIGIAVAIAFSAMLGGPTGFPSIVFVPFCGVFLVVILIIVFVAIQGTTQQRIPPPPPIQQPMVPVGAQGPIALNCPNCGAPPQNVDRFGVATCTYCNTRFLVR